MLELGGRLGVDRAVRVLRSSKILSIQHLSCGQLGLDEGTGRHREAEKHLPSQN